MNFQIAVELLNFGAFVGFILVNLSVIQHFYIGQNSEAQRTISPNLFFPLGGRVHMYLRLANLSTKAKVAGFIWLAIGVLYLSIVTRGFKTQLSQWSGDTFK